MAGQVRVGTARYGVCQLVRVHLGVLVQAGACKKTMIVDGLCGAISWLIALNTHSEVHSGLGCAHAATTSAVWCWVGGTAQT